MALIRTLSAAVLLTSLVLPLSIQRSYSFEINVSQAQASISDSEYVELLLNLEYLVAEFYLFGVMGRGLDVFAPELTKGGPHPVGGSLATLDTFTRDVFRQFALQKIGHLRAINREVKGFPRPLLNISKELFAEIVDQALEQTLNPPFNPYASSLNFLLASYVIADIAPPGYVGISPKLQNATFKGRTYLSIIGVVAGILGFTSVKGFVFCFLLMVITLLGFVVKTRFSTHSCFNSSHRVLRGGFLGGLMSLVLFWTYPSLIIFAPCQGKNSSKNTSFLADLKRILVTLAICLFHMGFTAMVSER